MNSYRHHTTEDTGYCCGELWSETAFAFASLDSKPKSLTAVARLLCLYHLLKLKTF